MMIVTLALFSMAFKIRKLDTQTTIGDELHTIRRKLNKTINEVSSTTKIQSRYLRAMEGNRWHDLPEPLYTRNFLRTYAKYLGLDTTYLLSRFEEERGCCDLVSPSQTPRQKVHRHRFLVGSRIAKLSLLGLLAFSVLGYLGWQVRSIIEPPALVVTTPHDGSTTPIPEITVEGKAEGETRVRVNGEEILPNPEGLFSTVVILERGLNIITIEGQRRYSREATVHRSVVFDKPEVDILSFNTPNVIN